MPGTLQLETIAQREARLDRHGGWTGMKIPGAPMVSARVAYGLKFPKISRTLPRNCEGAEHVKSGKTAGCPIITSLKHERELCRRYGYADKFDAPE